LLNAVLNITPLVYLAVQYTNAPFRFGDYRKHTGRYIVKKASFNGNFSMNLRIEKY
jgi:hypothetical protein